MIGRVHSIESFGTAGSPGIRTVIFLSGCPIRCLYYHNPDTWDPKGGVPMTAEDILNQYEQACPFYKKGDVAVSGGEPLMQIGFVTELSEKAKKGGIHTCLDTSGTTSNPGPQIVITHFDRLLASINSILPDIKHVDPEEHVKLCSQPQGNILAFTGYLGGKRIPVRIRHVVVSGIADREEYLYHPGRYLGTFEGMKALDIPPHHDMGKAKYHQLRIPYPLEGTAPLPPAKTAEARKIILQGMRDEGTHCP